AGVPPVRGRFSARCQRRHHAALGGTGSLLPHPHPDGSSRSRWRGAGDVGSQHSRAARARRRSADDECAQPAAGHRHRGDQGHRDGTGGDVLRAVPRRLADEPRSGRGPGPRARRPGGCRGQGHCCRGRGAEV
ncbi:MAG: Molybdate-binding domain of ModE, partial [uncultured Nocardioidaceae bacterium]